MTIFRAEDLSQHAIGLIRKRTARRYFVQDGKVVPFSENIEKGMKRYLYTSITPSGSAAMVAWNAPLSGLAANRVAVDERFVNIQPVVGIYNVGDDEILQGGIVDIDPVQVRVATAVQQVMEKIDEVGYSGEPDFNIYGITNQPNTNILAIPATGSAPITTALVNKNAQQIVDTLNLMLNNVAKATDGVYTSPHILLPTAAYIAACETTDAVNDNESALATFMKNARLLYDDVKVSHMPFLQTAGPTGNSVAIVYYNDSDFLEYVRVPGIDVKQYDGQLGGYVGTVKAYLGGIAIKDATPFSVVYDI